MASMTSCSDALQLGVDFMVPVLCKPLNYVFTGHFTPFLEWLPAVAACLVLLCSKQRVFWRNDFRITDDNFTVPDEVVL